MPLPKTVCIMSHDIKRKKDEISLSPMAKVPIPTESSTR